MGATEGLGGWILNFCFGFGFRKEADDFLFSLMSFFLSWLSRLGCRFVGDELWFSTSEPPKAEWHGEIASFH